MFENLSYNEIIIAFVIIVVIAFILFKYFNKEGFYPFQRAKEYFDKVILKSDNTMANTLNKVIEEKEKEDNNNLDNIESITEDLDINWNNKNNSNTYKPASYLEGERGNNYKELDLQDEYETQMAKSIDYSQMNNNDQFVPNDQGNGNYAPYSPSKEEYTVKDLMNSEKLLPQEENKDWFDTVEQPIKVKNRHLININKPIGVDSVASSLKNASWDIRGDIVNPKFAISPFNNSSIEPDINKVGFCNGNIYQ